MAMPITISTIAAMPPTDSQIAVDAAAELAADSASRDLIRSSLSAIRSLWTTSKAGLQDAPISARAFALDAASVDLASVTTEPQTPDIALLTPSAALSKSAFRSGSAATAPARFFSKPANAAVRFFSAAWLSASLVDAAFQ